MPSSRLNFETAAETRDRAFRRYSLGLILAFALLLASFQFLMPALMPDFRGGQADFVMKLLSDRRTDIVMGDSHVGQRDRMDADYLYLGRPGATTFELYQALKTYYRDKDPGRVILEAGPQLFAENRQMTWRTFNRDSFRYQVAPFSLYIFEPELIEKSPAIFGYKDDLRFRYRLRSKSKKLPRAVAQARKLSDELSAVKGRLATLEEIPIEARRILIDFRYELQLPVLSYRESLAWENFIAALDFLKARGAEVCLLRMPNSPEFQETIDTATTGWRYKAVIEDLRHEAEARGMGFFDYKEIFPDLPMLYFKNQDHLNDLGHEVFWPAAEARCFGEETGAATTGLDSEKIHLLTLENASFEAEIPVLESSGPKNPGPKNPGPKNPGPENPGPETSGLSCPIGWLWRSPMPVAQLRRFAEAVDESAFKSQYAYGTWDPDEATTSLPGGQWWSLGKRFLSQGGEAVEVALKVKSEGLLASLQGNETARDYISVSDDDAYIEIIAFDEKGDQIPLPDGAHYSMPLSYQAFQSGRRQLLPPPWYSLSHSFKLPEAARSFEVWMNAVSGGGAPRSLGWKGGDPSVLFDDFEISSNGGIEELALDLTNGIAGESNEAMPQPCDSK